AAYRQGRYDEAAARFQAVLAEDPNRLDALIGLGLAQYQLGAWDDAIDVLSRATALAPGHPAGRLFLGLAYLRRGDEGRADEHLTAYRDLRTDPRTASLVDRALQVLRGAPLTARSSGPSSPPASKIPPRGSVSSARRAARSRTRNGVG
ncbi:MAG: tetratricopeptide repeat protein, partial [Candidatus Rokuibacteriota bacterium]